MTAPVSRRTLLRAGAGTTGLLTLLALSGCTEDVTPPPPDPDRVALEAARAVEVALLQAVSVWGDGGTRAAEAVQIVDQHVQTLDAALGTSPSPSPSGESYSPSTEPEQSTADVQQLVDDAAGSHTRALRTASAAVSPLLASLAASDAALAALVRGVR